MTHVILRQCRDALIKGRQLLSVSQSEICDALWDNELDAWMNGHASLIDACDKELARTDGPSDQQVEAALTAKVNTQNPIGTNHHEYIRAMLTAAGVRAPRVVVPPGAILDADTDWLDAIRYAGCIPVDSNNQEIK
jgi:hypothetical protein